MLAHIEAYHAEGEHHYEGCHKGCCCGEGYLETALPEVHLRKLLLLLVNNIHDFVPGVHLGHLEVRLFFGIDGGRNQSQLCHFLLAVRTGIHMSLDNFLLGILKLVIIE